MSQIDKRIKVNTIIESQLPNFLVSDFPNATEFFKQYYISQEFQGGPSDLISNLDGSMKGTLSVVTKNDKNEQVVLVKEAGIVDYKKGEVILINI